MGGRGRRLFSGPSSFVTTVSTPSGITTAPTGRTAARFTAGGGGTTDAGNTPYFTSGVGYNQTSKNSTSSARFKERSSDDNHNSLLKHYDKVNLTTQQLASLRNYTGSTVNSSSYSNYGSGKNSNPLYKKHVEAIDRALDKRGINRNTVLFRGIAPGGGGEAFANKLASGGVGAVYSDSRFTSLSTSKYIADGFDGNSVIRYHLPKGTKGLYVAGKKLPHSGEREFIMSRHTKFQVLKIETSKSGRRTIDVRVIR